MCTPTWSSVVIAPRNAGHTSDRKGIFKCLFWGDHDATTSASSCSLLKSWMSCEDIRRIVIFTCATKACGMICRRPALKSWAVTHWKSRRICPQARRQSHHWLAAQRENSCGLLPQSAPCYASACLMVRLPIKLQYIALSKHYRALHRLSGVSSNHTGSHPFRKSDILADAGWVPQEHTSGPALPSA